jgi:hypothetical protein
VKIINCAGCDREHLLSNLKYYQGNALEELRKTMKTLSQKTEDLPNARRRQECFQLCFECKVVMILDWLQVAGLGGDG